MFKRIDHVEIVTDELDRTLRFYTDVLGFTVKSRERIEKSGLGVPIDLVYLDLGDHAHSVQRAWLRAARSMRARESMTAPEARIM